MTMNFAKEIEKKNCESNTHSSSQVKAERHFMWGIETLEKLKKDCVQDYRKLKKDYVQEQKTT